jgi:hypothetical protein
VDHGDMTENTIYINVHLFLGKILNEFHIAVSNSVHKRIPVVRGVKFVNEVGESIEEIDDLLGVSLFCISS